MRYDKDKIPRQCAILFRHAEKRKKKKNNNNKENLVVKNEREEQKNLKSAFGIFSCSKYSTTFF